MADVPADVPPTRAEAACTETTPIAVSAAAAPHSNINFNDTRRPRGRFPIAFIGTPIAQEKTALLANRR